MRSDPIIKTACLAIIGLLAIIVVTRALGAQSADLYALWLAGEFMSLGRLDQIYPQNTVMFDMTTPSQWWAHVSQSAPDARIFPYLYPPIWAKLMSWITGVTTFHAFDTVMTGINQMLLIASVFLAATMCNVKGTKRFVFVAASYAALSFTFPVGIAIEENQPQIIVSFLIVWAFERVQSGHHKTGGALLALAASIKLYPLLFVVIFAGRKQPKAIMSFICVGAGLGLSSIALAGWPLHAEYLRLVGVMSHSIIANDFTFSIDSGIARVFFLDSLTPVSLPGSAEGAASWGAMAKPATWASVSAGVQVITIAGVFWAALKRPNDVLLLPIAAIAFALLSPLSWCYSYMTALVFLGALALQGGRSGAYFIILIVVFFLPSMQPFTTGTGYDGPNIFQVGGTILMVLCMVAFMFARKSIWSVNT